MHEVVRKIIQAAGFGNGFRRGVDAMIRGSFSTCLRLPSQASRYMFSTGLPAMTTHGVRPAFVAASVTRNAATFAIFAAQLWAITENPHQMQTPTEHSRTPNMNTTLNTETAQIEKETQGHKSTGDGNPQKPSSDQVSQKPPLEPMTAKRKKWSRLLVILAVIALAAGTGFYIWQKLHPKNVGFASGNGRIEATDIDIAAKLAGRIEKIFVGEGDFAKAGQLLVQMQTDTLEAQLNEARAQRDMAVHNVNAAEAQVAAKESEKAAAAATVAQREANFDGAHSRLVRTEQLTREKVTSSQQLDDDRASEHAAEAAVKAAQAEVAAAQAATEAARAELVKAKSAVVSAEATISRIEADIRDSALKAPRDGRIQYKVAQEGEVLPAGGKVLNMVDLADVYMTFFLPEKQAGHVSMGTEARIILDAAPELVIPAKVTFVADVAQFTPKTVETKEERQKLTFRIKATIPAELLTKHMEKVKTGLPGVAYVKLEPNAQWPRNLEVKLPTE
jgi:HlyD family secretion protein